MLNVSEHVLIVCTCQTFIVNRKGLVVEEAQCPAVISWGKKNIEIYVVFIGVHVNALSTCRRDEVTFPLLSVSLRFQKFNYKGIAWLWPEDRAATSVPPTRAGVGAGVPCRRRLSRRASPRNARRESSINITEASPNLFHYPGILNCRCTETRSPALCKLIQ